MEKYLVYEFNIFGRFDFIFPLNKPEENRTIVVVG